MVLGACALGEGGRCAHERRRGLTRATSWRARARRGWLQAGSGRHALAHWPAALAAAWCDPCLRMLQRRPRSGRLARLHGPIAHDGNPSPIGSPGCILRLAVAGVRRIRNTPRGTEISPHRTNPRPSTCLAPGRAVPRNPAFKRRRDRGTYRESKESRASHRA